jgi:hypothetical protein
MLRVLQRTMPQAACKTSLARFALDMRLAHFERCDVALLVEHRGFDCRA